MSRNILNLKWLWALAFTMVLAGCDSAAKFNNTDITGSALKAEFKLDDLSGTQRTMDSYQGKVVAMFFGYTNCPDVCPITLQQLAVVKDKLGDKADDLQVLFVSVDPERDTPELLKQYVPQFHPSFDALTADNIEELKPLLEGMRVYHAKSGDTESDNYLVDHSSSIYLFDKNGNARLFVRHNSDPEPLAQDVLTLLNESA